MSYIFFGYEHPTCALSERTSTKPDNRRIEEKTRQTNEQTCVHITDTVDRAVDRRKDKHGKSVNQQLNLPTIDEENPVTT